MTIQPAFDLGPFQRATNVHFAGKRSFGFTVSPANFTDVHATIGLNNQAWTGYNVRHDTFPFPPLTEGLDGEFGTVDPSDGKINYLDVTGGAVQAPGDIYLTRCMMADSGLFFVTPMLNFYIDMLFTTIAGADPGAGTPIDETLFDGYNLHVRLHGTSHPDLLFNAAGIVSVSNGADFTDVAGGFSGTPYPFSAAEVYDIIFDTKPRVT